MVLHDHPNISAIICPRAATLGILTFFHSFLQDIFPLKYNITDLGNNEAFLP